jgi:hypothetical protein
LPEPALVCPECGAEPADNRRWTLRLSTLGLTLIAWGIALLAGAWTLSLGAASWLSHSIQGMSAFRAERPLWVLAALVGVVPALGVLTLMVATPPPGARKKAAVGATIVLAGVLLMVAGYRTVFETHHPDFWWPLGLSERQWTVPAVGAMVMAGLAASALARVAACLGAHRLERVLLRAAWLGPVIALAGLTGAIVLGQQARSVIEAAQEAAQQRTMAYQANRTSGPSMTFMPRIPWLWRNGVPLWSAALWAWCAAVAAGLFTAALVLRARVQHMLAINTSRSTGGPA